MGQCHSGLFAPRSLGMCKFARSITNKTVNWSVDRSTEIWVKTCYGAAFDIIKG